MLLLPWIAVAVLVFLPGGLARPDAARPAPTFNYDEYILKARPGPWGELQYSRILIEPPDEFAVQETDLVIPLRWVFPGYTPETLAALWQTAGLSPAQIAVLNRPGAVEPTADGLVVLPTPALILGLSTEARTAIYGVLSRSPENPVQNEPFRFRADSADEWFENSGLSPATLSLVKRLLYQRGTSLLFSDHPVVLPLLPSAAERTKLIKTLARKATLLVKLRIGPQSDVQTLADYWSQGPRRKAIYALLDSISQRPGGVTIDIAHLLPKFARAHLFTYPDFDDAPGAGSRDCHWTSLNFFNNTPDERFTDVAVVKETIERDYLNVTGRPQLGDLLVFMRPDGTVIHSCVFVADDIVFTKNGGSEMMPWILMNLSDVVAFYPADPALTIHAYRRKDL